MLLSCEVIRQLRLLNLIENGMSSEHNKTTLNCCIFLTSIHRNKSLIPEKIIFSVF